MKFCLKCNKSFKEQHRFNFICVKCVRDNSRIRVYSDGNHRRGVTTNEGRDNGT